MATVYPIIVANNTVSSIPPLIHNCTTLLSLPSSGYNIHCHTEVFSIHISITPSPPPSHTHTHAQSVSTFCTTVEPPLSGPPLSGTSIIVLFLIRFNKFRKWVCPLNAHARCSCYYGDRPAYLLRMHRQPCGTAVYH